jgi:hypothetical protein
MYREKAYKYLEHNLDAITHKKSTKSTRKAAGCVDTKNMVLE